MYKMGQVFPTKTTNTKEYVDIFVKEWFCRYGIPKSILSDNGSAFISELSQELYKAFGIEFSTSSMYLNHMDW